ncbi:hypothetical protein [Dactylosporangium sp. NPDC051484]|uniref:DUF7224 domain-containing protein n=1 Tax=Dactylosporangium sp. NPDC051484 TaxID=3154942 RepID=UPI00344BBE6F
MPDAIYLGIAADPAPKDVTASLATSILPRATPPCATRGEWPGVQAYSPLAAWLLLTAGMPETDLRGRGSPDDLALAVRARALPQQQQLVWFQANLATLDNCTTRPRLDPDTFVKETR